MSHDKLTLPALRLAAVSSLMLLSAQALATCSTDPYIGSVCYTAANFCPAPGYLPADGRTLNVSGYQALYSLLGNMYGGTAPATFALPDLRVRTVVGTGKQPATNVTMQPGQTRGQETTVLNPAQVPLVLHAHTLGSTTSQPITASATANLPVTVTVPAQAISVNGNLQIANDTASGQGTVTAGAILAKGVDKHRFTRLRLPRRPIPTSARHRPSRAQPAANKQMVRHKVNSILPSSCRKICLSPPPDRLQARRYPLSILKSA
ncbi:phage tail protein [Vogesella fluminis]|uniref:phage tail protein n=1 Tax=Vogesella fluminis TaxID=1069161 RepID=UPI00363026FA